MIFGQDRSELRRMYGTAWQKHLAGQPLSPLEIAIVQVIADHPEYQHAVLRDHDRDFTVESGETNPFLHMGLHLGIRDQAASDRPKGIRAVFESLAAQSADAHAAEHRMIDCLAETLWDAQANNVMPDESAYLDRLRRLL